MNFEHLIEINDAGGSGIPPLSRQQLWRGLVIRAEQPQLSVIGLDDCRMLDRGEAYIKRELRFGELLVRDTVSFEPMRCVVYETEPTEAMPASRLTMSIEEPSPGRLFVRFVYADLAARGESEDDRLYGAYLKQAYIDADVDTVATIRRLAGDGILNDQ